MGWNDARINLIAPGFAAVTEGEVVLDDEGYVCSPAIVRYVRKQATPNECISISSLNNFLRPRGFVIGDCRERTTTLERGAVQVYCAYDTPEDVGFIQVQFTLNRSSNLRLDEWSKFIESLSQRWPLQIEGRANNSMDASEIAQVLTSTHAWRDFASAYGWK